MQASIILCLSQAGINWEGCGRKGIQRKNGGMMEVGAPIVRMGWRRCVGAPASVIFPCTIKSRSWQAVMDEVDKGRAEFCVTAATVAMYQDCRHTDP